MSRRGADALLLAATTGAATLGSVLWVTGHLLPGGLLLGLTLVLGFAYVTSVSWWRGKR